MFTNTFWALIPPVIAIVLALITKEVYSSLFIGIAIGGLFVANLNPVGALDTIVNDGFITGISDNAGIFLFLVILGIMVALVNAAGGSAAFGRWAKKNIKTRVGVQIASFILGVLIFIDDYFNCLTVGSVMRPVTDTHRVSRQKLAYLIDATAAPVCMIAPISSWAAAFNSTASNLGSGMTGSELFVRAIPYNFYSLLTFVFIIAIILMKFDYGSMRVYEDRSLSTGDLGGLAGTEDDEEEANPRGRIIDLVLPVVVLIITCTLAMVKVGGFFGVDASGDTSCKGDIVAAFANTDPFIALPWGGLITLIFTVIYMLCRRLISFKNAMECVKTGFIAMIPAILILTMSVTLKNLTTLLGAREFVAGLMEGAAQSLYLLLPAVIFIVACVLSFATGTSWLTFGILIPIVTAIFPSGSELLVIGISACCAGAVCGDHCSPISDTTIMASAGAQCEHITHVSTQLPYAITVALISLVTYIIAGVIQSAWISLLIGTALTVGTLFVIRTINAKKQA